MESNMRQKVMITGHTHKIIRRRESILRRFFFQKVFIVFSIQLRLLGVFWGINFIDYTVIVFIVKISACVGFEFIEPSFVHVAFVIIVLVYEVQFLIDFFR